MQQLTTVIYSRVSSSNGRQSTTRQIVELKRYAEKEHLDLKHIFSENISGMVKNKNRAELENCILYCITNKIDLILVSEFSRLGRNTLEILKTMEILNNNKISVYIQNLNLTTLLPNKEINPIASIVMAVVGELGRMEWESIKDRLNSGRRLYIENEGKLGRKKGSVKTEQQKRIEYKDVFALFNKKYSIRAIAKITGHSISTIQRLKKLVYDSSNENSND